MFGGVVILADGSFYVGEVIDNPLVERNEVVLSVSEISRSSIGCGRERGFDFDRGHFQKQ